MLYIWNREERRQRALMQEAYESRQQSAPTNPETEIKAWVWVAIGAVLMGILLVGHYESMPENSRDVIIYMEQ